MIEFSKRRQWLPAGVATVAAVILKMSSVGSAGVVTTATGIAQDGYFQVSVTC